MKSSRLMIAVAFALFALLTPAFAQFASIKVAVPFDFTIGKQTLTAGEYRVTVTSPGLLMVRRTDGPGTAAVLTTYSGGGPYEDLRPRLIFHSYGGHHFLSEVWIDDVNPGHTLFASAAELEYARAERQSLTTLLASKLSKK